MIQTVLVNVARTERLQGVVKLNVIILGVTSYLKNRVKSYLNNHLKLHMKNDVKSG